MNSINIFKNDGSLMQEIWTPVDDKGKEPRLFVFAAGGTGMRVVEALVFLTAAGYMNENQYTIVPILFDFDLENGNLCQVETSLRLYRQLHQNCSETSFFRHKITPLYQNDMSFLFDMERNNDSLFDKYRLHDLFMKYNLLKKLSESLFGDLDMPESFLRTSWIGSSSFISNAPGNYARMLLGDLSQKDDFAKLFSQVGSKDAFVVVGSTYGNTGIASIFELANTLYHHFRPMRKAAIMLQPFFETTSGDFSAMAYEKKEMKMRSKETLKFFADHQIADKFNCTYFIGAETLSKLKMELGGQQQVTPFSVFELLAVTAITDFMKRTDEELRIQKSFCFGMTKQRPEGFCLDDLCATNAGKKVAECLTRFSLAMKYIYENDTDVDDGIWKALKRFADQYYQWIESMSCVNGGNGLFLFRLKESQYSKILKDRELVKHRALFSKQLFNKSTFVKAMGRKDDGLIERMTRASDYIFDNFISSSL